MIKALGRDRDLRDCAQTLDGFWEFTFQTFRDFSRKSILTLHAVEVIRKKKQSFLLSYLV